MEEEDLSSIDPGLIHSVLVDLDDTAVDAALQGDPNYTEQLTDQVSSGEGKEGPSFVFMKRMAFQKPFLCNILVTWQGMVSFQMKEGQRAFRSC